MIRRLIPAWKPLFLAACLLALTFLVACGGAATTEDPQAPAAPSSGDSGQSAAQPPAATTGAAAASSGQAAATAVTSGASAPVAQPTATPEAMAAPVDDWISRGKHGRTVNFVGVNNPGFWDVHYGASLTTTLTPSGVRFNQLVEYNPVNPDEIIGDLAESWEVSDDGTVYTFHLAEAQWSDGEPVKASDIVYSLDRIVLPDAFRGRTNSLRDLLRIPDRRSH